MKNLKPYRFEYLLLATVMLLSVAGFWNIYFGANSDPQPHHHLHVLTNFAWLFLLLYQLSLIGRSDYRSHRKAGLLVLAAAPLLFATTAMLSVHSAHKGLVSGQGDFLIVQNVMGTLELGAVIFLAFVLRKRRKLHGALLMSTTMLFMGIALFFALVSFAPPFRIEGPETFYRFATAGAASRYACMGVGLLFFIRRPKDGWPFLLVASFFSVNEWLNSLLAKYDLIDPLTEGVGSMSQPLAFIGGFVVLVALLAATGILVRGEMMVPKPVKKPG